MNIIKLQNMLRSVPDEALIGYVQNPTGQVPSYLALSELQRRKDTRDKYQAQQAPESSVAEDLEQETMSDQGGLAMLAKNPDLSPGAPTSQGVADLPVDDSMYQEDSFAAGGIVAFAGKDGSYVQSYPNYEGPSTSAFGRGIDYLTGGLKNYANKKSQLMDLQRQIETLQPNLFESLTPSELSTRKAKIQELKAQQDAIRNPSSGYVYKEGEATVDPTMKSYVEQEVQRKLETSKEKPKATEGEPAAKTKPALKDTTPTQQPAESEEDYLRKRMALYKEFMGPNEDRTKLQEKIDAMEKRAQRQEDMAPWMALTEAGFKTMQGTSPYALANIGAGAEVGIKSYGAAQDKLAALEEKRYALMNEAAKADRAEKQAIIKFGFDSEEAKLNRDQKERLGQAELSLRREANQLTKDFNIARLGALTTGKTTKAMAELIQKTNAPIDKKLATLVMAGSKSKEVQDMIKSLQAEKMANEKKIRAMFGEDATESPAVASNADPLGIMK